MLNSDETAKHECDRMPTGAYVIECIDGSWVADCEAIDAWAASGAENINFCPWCGVAVEQRVRP